MAVKDGLRFEQLFMSEVGYFRDADQGVSADSVMAALVARREKKFDLLKLIHERRLEPMEYVHDDDLFCIVPTKGKEVLTFKWVN
jgi:hypothetical protein